MSLIYYMLILLKIACEQAFMCCGMSKDEVARDELALASLADSSLMSQYTRTCSQAILKKTNTV